jgi:hypothetical protein
MKIEKKRFQAILDGTATNLTGSEVLVRNIAYLAERRGENPQVAIEKELLNVTIVDTDETINRVKRPPERMVSAATPPKINLDTPRAQPPRLAALTRPAEMKLEDKKQGTQNTLFRSLVEALGLGMLVSFVGGGALVVLIPVYLLDLSGPAVLPMAAIISVLLFALLAKIKKQRE